MNFAQLALTALGLSMDAFAAAVCQGLNLKKPRARDVLLVGLLFGAFQALMPFIGWLMGSQFEDYITPVDHWFAFILLGAIGGKMVFDSVKRQDSCETCLKERTKFRELLILAVATSIDALAVGITFAFLQAPIGPAAGLIGAVTFVLSAAGVLIGHRFGVKYQSKAELAGGLILILLGTKILLEHLGVLK